jgi:hypothetical protein
LFQARSGIGVDPEITQPVNVGIGTSQRIAQYADERNLVVIEAIRSVMCREEKSQEFRAIVDRHDFKSNKCGVGG